MHRAEPTGSSCLGAGHLLLAASVGLSLAVQALLTPCPAVPLAGEYTKSDLSRLSYTDIPTASLAAFNTLRAAAGSRVLYTTNQGPVLIRVGAGPTWRHTSRAA